MTDVEKRMANETMGWSNEGAAESKKHRETKDQPGLKSVDRAVDGWFRHACGDAKR